MTDEQGIAFKLEQAVMLTLNVLNCAFIGLCPFSSRCTIILPSSTTLSVCPSFDTEGHFASVLR